MTAPNPQTSAPASSQMQGSGPMIEDRRRRLIVYLFMMSAVFMSMMDVQIVSTALPTIVGEFGEIERFSWISAAYLLVSSIVMPIHGKLGDLYGRKYVLITVIAIFVVGSLACAMAVSMNTLIAARVLQALGGGGVMVMVMSINADLFEPRERAKYQSYSSLVLLLAGSIGPTLGGFLTDHFGWRSIFFINLPIGLAVIAGLSILLPSKRPRRNHKIDFAGAITLAGAIASLVLFADSPSLFGSLLSPQTLVVVVVGVISAIAWVLVERRAEEPIIPLTLLQDRSIALLLMVSMAGGCMGIGMSNYYALFLQSGLGLAASQAGLFFIPLTMGIAFGSVNAGRLISRTGLYKPFAIASTATAATFLISLSFVDQTSSLILVAALMFLQGMGTGIGQQVPILGIQNAAPAKDVGSATGLTTLSRMGGASIGISLYGALVSLVVTQSVLPIPGVEHLENLTPADMAALSESSRHLVNEVYLSALQPVFYVAAAIGFLGCLAAICLQNRQLGGPKK